MATYPAYEPQWVGVGSITGPRVAQGLPDQVALWRSGDILQLVTTGGPIYTPTGGAGNFTNATGLLTPGPSLGLNPIPFQMSTSSSTQTQGAVTVTATASAAAPAQTYFAVVTYNIGTANPPTIESQPSQAFIINVASGIVPGIQVSATGAPAGATTYSVYLSPFPNTFWLQRAATIFATATGITYPLTVRVGLNKAASAATTNIFGLADSDSDAYYAGVQGATAGGSFLNGKRSLFGATQSFAPGWTNDAFYLPVTKLQVGLVEITLVQYAGAQLYQSVGWGIDATTGYFVADTTLAAAGTIVAFADNPGGGSTGDIGTRVRVQPTASTLI